MSERSLSNMVLEPSSTRFSNPLQDASITSTAQSRSPRRRLCKLWAHRKSQSLRILFRHAPPNAIYDYSIVRVGTAGLVVVNQLAEDPNLSIAVVELGSLYEISNGNLNQIPFFSTRYVSGDPKDVQPLIDLELDTVPQPAGFEIFGKRKWVKRKES